MNKWITIKKEVINLRSLLTNYKKVIPKTQLPRFEKDLELLFEKYQISENEIELEKIKKLAKTKLNSMIRVYGELKEDETTIDKEFLDEESKNFAEKILEKNRKTKENFADSINDDYLTRLNKIKNSEFFNKEIVNQAQKDLEEYQNMILEAQKVAEEKQMEDMRKDFDNNKNNWIEKYKGKLKDIVMDLCVKKEVSNIEDTINSIDFDKMAKHLIDMDLHPENYSNESKEEKLEDLLNSFENILSGCKNKNICFFVKVSFNYF